MKKTFLFAMAVAAAAFASCSKNTDINVPEPIGTDAPQVRLTLGTDTDPHTRAFFGSSDMAEPWENTVNTMTVYAFDNAGKFIIKRSLTSLEVSAKSARLSLPNSVAETNCSFYVVANSNYGDVATSAAMDALTESAAPGDYNGTFAQVTGGSKRSGGFVMTGKATAAVAAVGSSSTVAVTVKRTVAKIAIRTRMDAAFASAYGNGTITINSIALSKASLSSMSFSGGYASRSSFYTATQTAQKTGTNYDGLFYIYENGTLAAGSRVMLTLTGVFDADGNASTTADRSDVEYKIELTGAGNGEIRRNGYYRVDANIKGLSGDAVGVNISVANWETPVTQTVNLGN